MTSRTRQTTFDESLGRWRVCNKGAQAIPPFSIVAIGASADLNLGAIDRDGEGTGRGKFTIDVRRPDTRSIVTGSPGQFLITGNASIDPNKFGYATKTMPVWCEVDTTVNQRGMSVMPRPNQFKLYPGGGFFTVMDVKVAGSKRFALIEHDHHSVMIRARTPSGGIAAATSSSTFPVAECDLYHVIDNGTTVTHTQLLDGVTPIRVRVCNLSTTGPIPGNIFVGITRHAGGAFAVTWQDCG